MFNNLDIYLRSKNWYKNTHEIISILQKLAPNKIHRIIAINFTKMGTTKFEAFTTPQNELAKYAKALSHPARIAIIELLLQKQSCICGNIVEELPLSQSTVSQHLKELKAAGLIKGRIEGVKVCYCIDEKAWEMAKNCMLTLLQTNVLLNNSCC